MRKLFFVACLLAIGALGSCDGRDVTAVRLQLNWLHDPTFAGEYLLSENEEVEVKILEGGPNLFPVAEVKQGRADIAVVGADIFLKGLAEDYSRSGKSSLVSFFVDFQRNPVGWILHPDAARALNLPEDIRNDAKKLNDWLFEMLTSGDLQIGDKRGTETTSIWVAWKNKRNLSDDVKVFPVGFDATIVLDAPKLAYPVYMNEEPFKLGEKIGEPVIEFDPHLDGIRQYGNILITTKKFAKENRNVIRELQNQLREAWNKARKDPKTAVKKVMEVYTGVGESVVTMQIGKTLEFVFNGEAEAGSMDQSDGGRWEQTLAQLQTAGIVSEVLTMEILRNHLIEPL